MSAKWMRVETDFVDHPKVHRLTSLLNDPLAGWYVMRLWSWLSRFCPTGQIRDTDGTSIEVACGWRGEPGKLLNALVETEWLDEETGGGWEAHDWSDHQGRVAANAQKERERKRLYRAKKACSTPAIVPELSHGTSAGHPALRDVTGRDVTYKETTLSSKLDLSGTIPPEGLDEKLTADEYDVFEKWRQVMNSPRSVALPSRKKLIAKWLKLYDVGQLQAAIVGCSLDRFSMGDNDRHSKFNSLEVILRDKNIEKFIALATEGAR